MLTVDLKKVKSAHFVGLKGIGMAALACIAQDYGIKVSGSDINDYFVTDKLIKKRRFDYRHCFSVKNIQSPDLVIYSAGHDGARNIEVLTAQKKRIPILTQAEFLGLMTAGKKVIAVAGVGGKSTTAAILAYIFQQARLKPSYFIGVGSVDPLGDPGKFNPEGNFFITEADEYFDPKLRCPKFLTQKPTMVVLTNLAFDHPDVYHDLNETLKYFSKFLMKVPSNGLIIANIDNHLIKKLIATINKPVKTYGFSTDANIVIQKSDTRLNHNDFSLYDRKLMTASSFSLRLPGDYNLLNAAAAAVVAMSCQIKENSVKRALSLFNGTKRRFEKIFVQRKYALYDDYAHHPQQIVSVLKSARMLYPQTKIVVIFQSHTFSRTKALLSDFSHSFKDVDKVLICNIFASSREKGNGSKLAIRLARAISGVSHNAVYCANQKKALSDLRRTLKFPSVVITLGAGNLFAWHEDIIKILKEKTS